MRRRRYGYARDAEGPERVGEAVDDHGRRRSGAALAARLDAQGIGGRGHFVEARRERGDVVGARQGVVHQRAGERLAARTVDDADLAQRLPDTLNDAAMGLALDDQRVDGAAHVVDGDVAHEIDGAGLRVHLDLAHVAAVGEHELVHLVVTHDRETVGHLEQPDPTIGARNGEPAARVRHVVRRGLQGKGRAALALGDQVVRRERDDRARHAHRAPGVRAAAEAHEVGVAGQDAYRLDLEPEAGGRDLGEARLVPLARGLGADHDLDDPVRAHRHPRLLARRAGGGLDVVGQPEPEELAARPRFGAAPAEATPVGEAHRERHVLGVPSAVVDHAERVGVGHLGLADQVAAAELDSVDARRVGGEIDQPLDREGDLGPAR